MKNLIIAALLMSSLTAAAQKQDTICERLYSVKRINNHFYLLNLGGRYPDQKYTAVLKGKQDDMELSALIDSMICIAGTMEMYRGKPELVISGRFKTIKK